MNYSPNNYKKLINIQDDLGDQLYALDSISYNTEIEDAVDDLASIEKNVGKISSYIQDLTHDMNSGIYTLISEDLDRKQKMYLEMVKLGYEKDPFPFEQWGEKKYLKDWFDSSLINGLQPMVKNKNCDILFLKNIVGFYDAMMSNNKKNEYLTLKYSLESIDKMSSETTVQQKEKIKECFIFEKEMTPYLSNLLIVEKSTSKPFMSDKILSYLNILYEKENIEKNDAEIKKIMQFLADNKSNKKTQEIIKQFCIDITTIKPGNNFFISYNNKSIYEVNCSHYISLFQYDIAHDVGFTPYLVQELKKLQKDSMNKDNNKETLGNTIMEIEKGYHVFVLDRELGKKNSKNIARIKI